MRPPNLRRAVYAEAPVRENNGEENSTFGSRSRPLSIIGARSSVLCTVSTRVLLGSSEEEEGSRKDELILGVIGTESDFI